MNNFVICAYKQVGKTTLVKKLIENTNKDVCGLLTTKLTMLQKEDALCPVYIYPVTEKPVYDEDHLIGYCGAGKHYTNPEVFDSLGLKYLEIKGSQPLVIIDEIGFLEADAKKFQEKIFELLDSDIPVVLTIKQRQDIDFINRIKAYPDKEYFEMTEENRDEIFKIIKEKIDLL